MNIKSSGRKQALFSGLILMLALGLLPFLDIELSASEPWPELLLIAKGFLTPDFYSIENVFQSIAYTLAFALLGVISAALAGFTISLFYQYRLIRLGCAIIRSIHELFWGLIFLQVFGLSPLTGLLAIALPFTGTFAKVYSEIFEQVKPLPELSISVKAQALSRFFYTRIPQVWPQLLTYTRYRLECGLRSSAILGFIGLPTLGFHLETAYKQGLYAQGAALLLLFFALIASIRSYVSS